MDRFVSLSGAHITPYINWATAATNIQSAVDASAAGDVVWVSNGVYNTGGRAEYGAMTNRLSIRKAITVRSVNGPASTIIEGSGPIAPTAIRCVYLGANSKLIGFTLQKGHTLGTGNWYAEQSGGGAYLEQGAEMSYCLLKDNKANSTGGGVVGYGLMHNCLVVGNQASQGGGIRDMTTVNCTIVNNEAVGGGGGGVSFGTFQNCIIYYNYQFGVENNYLGSYSTFSYSCVRPYRSGEGNITNIPGIVAFDSPQLLEVSLCIDSGDFSLASGAYDLDGNPRVWGGGVDMGADEYYPPSQTGVVSMSIRASSQRAVWNTPLRFDCSVTGSVFGTQWDMGDGSVFSNVPVVYHAYTNTGEFAVKFGAWNNTHFVSVTSTVTIYPGYTNYVVPSGVPVWPYTNWTSASTTLQEAVLANIPGGTMLVSNGMYDSGYEISPGGLMSRLVLTNDVIVRSVNGAMTTIIAGESPFGTGAVRGVYIDGESTLDGFTVTNGFTHTNSLLSSEALSGGGIWCSSDQVVSNCIITGCGAWENGGGVYGGTLKNCSLLANDAAVDGGGSYGGTLDSCIISDNRAAWYGGGACNARLSRCRVRNNTSVMYGGGIYGGSVENSVIYSNHGNWGGGAAYANLFYNTIVKNTAVDMAGGIYFCQASNSIIFFNVAGQDWDNYLNSICLYSCTHPDPVAQGSIIDDPKLRDIDKDDFMLMADSPCIDSGLTNPLSTDLVGTPRPLDGNGNGHAGYDMGAYECSRYRYVAPGGGNVWPYSTWADAAHAIQDAINAAIEGTIVLVSNGNYSSGGKVINGTLTNRVALDKAITVQSMHGPEQTIIQGAGPMGDGAVRCAYIAGPAVLCGFMLTNGYTRNVGDYQTEQCGGGVLLGDGGVLSNCMITGCGAQSGGGVSGGLIRNAVIWGNIAAELGGGCYSGLLENCTVVDNSAGGEGGGIYRSEAMNCIIWSNRVAGVSQDHWESTINYSCTLPNPGGVGNITNQPGFTDYIGRNFLPVSNSPCLDAGVTNTVRFDIRGIGRPLDGKNNGSAIWDMGAYEVVNSLSDSDADGLSDTNEIDAIGTNPAQADTDGDGQHDGSEVIAGTDPLSITSYFAVISWQQMD
ncbi:MAG: PKD domain-containing protein, partial [Verrucomicrobiae bacterium]|nr:PKD domain-containing protein [Verrucomicrobiae bacterium]